MDTEIGKSTIYLVVAVVMDPKFDAFVLNLTAGNRAGPDVRIRQGYFGRARLE